MSDETGGRPARPSATDAGGAVPPTAGYEGSKMSPASRLESAAPQEMSPRRRRLRRMADATRGVIDATVATGAPDEVVNAATERLEEALALLEPYRSERFYYGLREAANAGEHLDGIFDGSPLFGIANPLVPPLTMEVDGGRVIARVRFGQAYEGPPTCVHGGYVAAAFDEVLGGAQSLSGSAGMTGTLTVRYESPTPLHEDLVIVGEMVGTERRKIFTEGRMLAGDRVTATAKGTFISLTPGGFIEALAERRAAEPGDR